MVVIKTRTILHLIDVEPLIARVDFAVLALPHGGSLSEYELMKRLTEEGVLPRGSSSGHLSLFQKHFLVMHSLYVLRQRYIEQGVGVLSISATRISFQPYSSQSERGLSFESEGAGLNDYYCDIGNLLNQTEGGVKELLDSFWRDFSQYQKVSNGELDSALALFDLNLPLDEPTLNKTYRKLMQSAHPDKGGDKARFIETQEAYALLRASVKINRR